MLPELRIVSAHSSHFSRRRRPAFTKEKVGGASDLAKAAATAAGDAQKVAKSGKVDASTTKAVTDSCQGCHMTYREKDASTGAYKLKGSVIVFVNLI
jgi:cytochrome c556